MSVWACTVFFSKNSSQRSSQEKGKYVDNCPVQKFLYKNSLLWRKRKKNTYVM